MKKNDENALRSDLSEDARAQGYYVVDIPDEIKRILSMLCPSDRRKAIRCITLKPFDIGLVKDGKFTALELKHVSDAFTFSFARIESHQIDNLMEIEEHGCKGFILVSFRKTLTTVQKKKYGQVNHLMHRAFLIPVKRLKALMVMGVKSLSVLELAKDFSELPREKGSWKINF